MLHRYVQPDRNVDEFADDDRNDACETSEDGKDYWNRNRETG